MGSQDDLAELSGLGEVLVGLSDVAEAEYLGEGNHELPGVPAWHERFAHCPHDLCLLFSRPRTHRRAGDDGAPIHEREQVNLDAAPRADPNDHNVGVRVQHAKGQAEMSGTNQLKNDVDATKRGDLLERDRLVCAECEQLIMGVTRACHRNHFGAERTRNLHPGDSDATRGARDQHPLSSPKVCLGDERVVGGEEGLGKAPRLIEFDVVWHEQQVFGRHQAVRGLSATADNGADPSPEQRLYDAISNRRDDARQLHAGNIFGPSGWGWVDARSLEKIGRVEARRMNANDDVVGTGLGGGALFESENARVKGDGAHTSILRVGPWTVRAVRRYGQEMTIFDAPINTLSGEPTTLEKFKGETLLFVNVASKCGLTPQYEGLEALQELYGVRGFSVLGFPCNQFAEQEPGTAEEIQSFCSTNYNVTFPLFAKIDVNGEHQHPIYAELEKAQDEEGYSGDVRWNFEKFLVARDGTVLRFAPQVTPEDPKLRVAIETDLD